MDQRSSKSVTLKEIFLVLALFCIAVHPAPAGFQEVTNNNEVIDEDSKSPQSPVDIEGPTRIIDDVSQEDDAASPTLEGDVRLHSEDSTEMAVIESEDSEEDKTTDYSFLDFKGNTQYSDYSSSPSSGPDYEAHEFSLDKPYFPHENDVGEVYFNADEDEGNQEAKQRLQMMLCSVLNLCEDREVKGNQVGLGEYEYYSSSESYSGLNVPDDSDNETGSDEGDQDTVSLPKLSGKSSNDHGHHRAKRDLSWDLFGDTDDEEAQLYKEQLDILADLLNEDTNAQDTLADVLDDIEGIRSDGMTAADILDEFEHDQEFEDDKEDLDDTDKALDNFVLRKRGSTPRNDMRHYVQSLPTLEGMRKRNVISDQLFSGGNDFNDINGNAYSHDFIIAAENELAAEELEHIETQAQVAAAMLDDAAKLIKLIEDTTVDLVGDYLGLDEDDDEPDDNAIDFSVDFEEFPQYLPPVPPVSIEKRIGRQRTYDHPFVPEDIERPFKGAFESVSKPRNSGSRIRGSNNYRRPPPLQKPYQWSGRMSPPLYNDRQRPIGIFPSYDFMRPRLRRNQGYYVRGSVLDDLFKSKRGGSTLGTEYEALPLIADDIPTDDPTLWEMLARESPRIFPIDDTIMGRIGPNGRPYVDGVFTPYTKSTGDSLDKLWPLVNTVDRDIPLDAGLEEAYEAAAMMQDEMERENQRLEEQDNSIGMGTADDEEVNNLLSNIFRERIK